MFPAALTQAADFACPAIAVCHQFCFRIIDRWHSTNNNMLNGTALSESRSDSAAII